MRLINVLVVTTLAAAAGLLLPCDALSAPPLATVPHVDLNRYVGHWYEIARYPNRFQRDCTRNVTATYSIRGDGSIEVVNACTRGDGTLDKAVGTARVVDPVTNAKLEVLFAPAIISFLPFVWGDYWIIDLAADYSYAVVGEPSRDYLWILARTPTLEEPVLRRILERLPESGYDPKRLIRTTAAP